MMHAELRRRVTLSDLIILVAATALGMGVLRLTVESSSGGYLRHVPAPHSHWTGRLGYHPPFYWFFALVNGVPQILVGSACVVALSLRRHRSSPLPLSHRSGFVLCLATLVASTATAIVHGSALLMQGYDLALWSLVVFGILPNSGFMVLGAWMALVLSGRGGPIGSVLDRIGYFLGASLITLLALESCRMLLESARVV